VVSRDSPDRAKWRHQDKMLSLRDASSDVTSRSRTNRPSKYHDIFVWETNVMDNPVQSYRIAFDYVWIFITLHTRPVTWILQSKDIRFQVRPKLMEEFHQESKVLGIPMKEQYAYWRYLA
jgi:hypothetical protein